MRQKGTEVFIEHARPHRFRHRIPDGQTPGQNKWPVIAHITKKILIFFGFEFLPPPHTLGSLLKMSNLQRGKKVPQVVWI